MGGVLKPGYGLKGRNFTGDNVVTWELDSSVTGSGFVLTSDPRLTDARPASDVYAWAKNPVKPTYTYNEVGAASTTDPRLSDARTPVAHTHTASNITDFATAVAATSAVTANTAKVTNATHTGDVTGATTLTIANKQTLTASNGVNVSNTPTVIGASAPAISLTYGTGANTVCVGNDSRLSDTRTPKAHALIDTTGHTATGLTTRHVLRATGATTYAFGAIEAADVPTLNQDTTGQAGKVANALTIGTGLTSAGTYDGANARTVAINYAVDHTFSATVNIAKLIAENGLFKGQLEANVFVKNSINVVSGDLRVTTASKLNGAVTAVATSVPVVDGSAFAITDICSIEGELVRVTNIATNTLTVTRAFGGTTGAVHADGAVIHKLGTYNTANKGFVQIDGQSNVVEIHNFSTTTSAYTDTISAEFGKLASVPVAGFNDRYGVYADVAFFGNATNYMSYKDGVLEVKGDIQADNIDEDYYYVDASYQYNLNQFFIDNFTYSGGYYQVTKNSKFFFDNNVSFLLTAALPIQGGFGAYLDFIGASISFNNYNMTFIRNYTNVAFGVSFTRSTLHLGTGGLVVDASRFEIDSCHITSSTTVAVKSMLALTGVYSGFCTNNIFTTYDKRICMSFNWVSNFNISNNHFRPYNSNTGVTAKVYAIFSLGDYFVNVNIFNNIFRQEGPSPLDCSYLLEAVPDWDTVRNSLNFTNNMVFINCDDAAYTYSGMFYIHGTYEIDTNTVNISDNVFFGQCKYFIKTSGIAESIISNNIGYNTAEYFCNYFLHEYANETAGGINNCIISGNKIKAYNKFIDVYRMTDTKVLNNLVESYDAANVGVATSFGNNYFTDNIGLNLTGV